MSVVGPFVYCEALLEKMKCYSLSKAILKTAAKRPLG